VTWLGHASAIFSSPKSSVWVDPLLRPKIKWAGKEKKECFSNSFSDSLLMDQYDSYPTPIPIHDLASPDAVCITHQDIDHFDLGTLMMLPNHTPIIIPEYTGNPWDVDLMTVMRKILGKERKIVVLKHNESFKVRDIKITAFPFIGEMDKNLAHKWNCYLIETTKSAAIFTADSEVNDSTVQNLKKLLGKKTKDVVMFGRDPHDGSVMAGAADVTNFDDFFNGGRLDGWYSRVSDLFSEIPMIGPTWPVVKKLNKENSLKQYFPYATGGTPWFRIQDDNNLLKVNVGNHTTDLIQIVEKKLKTINKNLKMFPGKYGKAIPIKSLD